MKKYMTQFNGIAGIRYFFLYEFLRMALITDPEESTSISYAISMAEGVAVAVAVVLAISCPRFSNINGEIFISSLLGSDNSVGRSYQWGSRSCSCAPMKDRK